MNSLIMVSLKESLFKPHYIYLPVEWILYKRHSIWWNSGYILENAPPCKWKNLHYKHSASFLISYFSWKDLLSFLFNSLSLHGEFWELSPKPSVAFLPNARKFPWLVEKRKGNISFRSKIRQHRWEVGLRLPPPNPQQRIVFVTLFYLLTKTLSTPA